MPVYEYIAKSLKGETKKGIKTAKDQKDLAQVLKQEGYFLISAVSQERKLKKIFKIPTLKHVPLAQKLLVTKNLQVMIGAGIALPRALDVLAEQTTNKYFKTALKEVKEEILKGAAFSKALFSYPKIFPKVYVSMIKVGEETGELEKVLGILGEQMDRNYQLRARVKGAMMYPSIIVGAMFLIGAVMMIKVVPQLSETFTELEIELPLMTRIIIAMGDFFAAMWFVILLALVLLAFLFYMFIKSKKGKQTVHKILLKMPVIGPLIKKINSAYSALSLSALVQGGVPIVMSIKIASDAVNNVFYQKALVSAANRVQKGKKLSACIALYPELFSPLYVQMLQVGEETGQTSEMLDKLAEFLENDVNEKTKNLSSIIEPVLLLLIGGAVAVFAISLVQPIYSILQGI